MKWNQDCKSKLPAFTRECPSYAVEWTDFQELCAGCEMRKEEERKKRDDEGERKTLCVSN